MLRVCPSFVLSFVFFLVLLLLLSLLVLLSSLLALFVLVSLWVFGFSFSLSDYMQKRKGAKVLPLASSLRVLLAFSLVGLIVSRCRTAFV